MKLGVNNHFIRSFLQIFIKITQTFGFLLMVIFEHVWFFFSDFNISGETSVTQTLAKPKHVAKQSYKTQFKVDKTAFIITPS